MASSSLRRDVTPRNEAPISALDQVDSRTAAQPKSVPLSEKMWESSQSLAHDALETQFLHGIRHGSLHPEQYGAYFVQDIAYLSSAVQEFDTLLEKAQTREVQEILQKLRDSYQKYLSLYMKKWHIEDPSALALNQAVQNYIDFLRKVALCKDPVYLVVAMIPCSRLWYWLANQMVAYEGASNVYSFWVRENKQRSGGKKLENFVDSYPDSNLCHDTALKIYQAAMLCEVNFMRSACNQVLVPLPEGLDDALEKAKH